MKTKPEILELQKKIIAWEKCFIPAVVGPLIIVNPSHKKRIPKKLIEIRLEPSLVFGTGSNSMTKGIIEKMIQLYPTQGPFKSVLDFGSGSGVLALVAEKLGSKKIHAVENCNQALKLIQKNVKLNRSKIRGFSSIPPNHTYDLIVSNLYEPLFCKLAGQFAQVTNPNGKMLLTGIISGIRHENIIRRAYEKVGFHIESVDNNNGWLVVGLSRQPKSKLELLRT